MVMTLDSARSVATVGFGLQQHGRWLAGVHESGARVAVRMWRGHGARVARTQGHKLAVQGWRGRGERATRLAGESGGQCGHLMAASHVDCGAHVRF